MFSTAAIVISLLCLMFFAYRGYSVLLLAPLMATLAVLLSGDIAMMMPIYTETFMDALGVIFSSSSRSSCWGRCSDS
ncbi:hypothetical protein ACPF7Z_09400 [Halomonas sp. GXIMD04776]|uniref:hypothetical protein n=1 Tax=Halomonas sp. GXIMD04776 TaxID=3415605 RepID=UPI003C9792C1